MIAAKRMVLLLAVLVAGLGIWRGIDMLTRPAAEVPRPSSAPKPEVLQAPPSSPAPLLQKLPPRESVGYKLKALAASGDPEQHFQAFQMIEECLTLERDKEIVDHVEVKMAKVGAGNEIQIQSHKADEQKLQALRASCSTMTGRDRIDRFQLLQYALDRHVGGALAAYVLAGPQGDPQALTERPDDPAVRAWRADALKRLDESVAAGYPDALLFSITGFGILGREQSLSALYMESLAANKVTGAINSNDGVLPQSVLDAWSSSISEQQKRDAQAEADRIFQAWKTRTAASQAH